MQQPNSLPIEPVLEVGDHKNWESKLLPNNGKQTESSPNARISKTKSGNYKF